MTAATDQELVARLRQCDPVAFDEVYERYRARLFGFLVRLSGSREVAEDLLQETWLRLATRVRTLRDDTKLRSWLFTVANHLHASHRRSTILTAARLAGFLRFSSGEREAVSPFEDVARDERERRFERVIVSLPLRYREALLAALEGIPQAEAAAVCKLTPAAYRQRLSRARTMAARRMSESSRQASQPMGSSLVSGNPAGGKAS